MNRVSSDNANMRNTEAYANMDCHGELETSRALLVESKQPGASENKPSRSCSGMCMEYS